MLVRFLARRVAVLAASASAAALVLDGFSAAAPLGVLLGCFLSLYKTRVTALTLQRAAEGTASPGDSLARVLSLVMILVLLALSAKANTHLFYGMTAGLCLLPLYICFNAITEYTGLTHNAWGGEA